MKMYQRLTEMSANKLNINIESCQSTEHYIKLVLIAVQAKNRPSYHLRHQREKTRNDLEDLESCFVANDTYSDEPSGYNPDGYKPNTVERRQLEKKKLKEKLEKLLMSTMLIEKQNEVMNQIIEELIDMLPQDTYNETLKLHYIDCMKVTVIADMTYQSENTVKSQISRGRVALAKLIDNLKRTQS